MKTKVKTIELTSRKDIMKVLEEKHINISNWAKEIIPKVDFTEGIKYEVVIIKCEEMSKDWFTTQEVREEAKKRGYITPPAEVALLLREKLSDQDIAAMGLSWIIGMHEPIKDSGGHPVLLGASRAGSGSWVDAFSGWRGHGWDRGSGFAFVVPQVSAQDSDTQLSSETLPLELAIKICKEAGLLVYEPK